MAKGLQSRYAIFGKDLVSKVKFGIIRSFQDRTDLQAVMGGGGLNLARTARPYACETHDFSPIDSICFRTTGRSSHAFAVKHRTLAEDDISEGEHRETDFAPQFQSVSQLRPVLSDYRNLHCD